MQSEKCTICNVVFANKKMGVAHFAGKKHIYLQRKKSCEVLVTDLPERFDRLGIKDYFESFGTIIRCLFSPDNKFIIFRYAKKLVPQKVLAKKNITYCGHKLTVKSTLLINEDIISDSKDKQAENLEKLISNSSEFSEQVSLFLTNALPDEKILAKNVNTICSDLKAILEKIFSNCIVHPYGSAVTGLSLKDSDVDLYVEVKAEFKKGKSQEDLILMAKHIMTRKKKSAFVIALILPKARTPIIKCIHLVTDINVDFHFKSPLGTLNSKFLKYFISLNTNFRATLLLLKYWGKRRKFVGQSNMFSSYALTMMFIFCIQNIDPAYPSVYSLQSNEAFEEIVNGWNCGFEQKLVVKRILDQEPIIELLRKFFEFYVNFDFNTQAICPYLGKPVLKSQLLNVDNLGDEFKWYKHNFAETKVAIDSNRPICIQDPFELSRNIVASIEHKVLEKLTQACSVSLILVNNPFPSLHALFTQETASKTNVELPSSASHLIQFKIGVGNCLDYLKLQTKDCDLSDKNVAVRKAWFSTFENYMLRVLKDILKLKIIHAQSMNWNDYQSCNEVNSSRCDTDLSVLIIKCLGKRDIIASRKKISLKLSIPENISTVLGKEEYISDQVLNPTSNFTYDFSVFLKPLIEPVEVEVELKTGGAFKGSFFTFSHFFMKNVPEWFSKYQCELNVATKKGMLSQS